MRSGNYCDELHRFFNNMHIYYPNEISQLNDRINFRNGIYIMFEDGEDYDDAEIHRVVRVGTHKAAGRLIERLKNHFIHKNKNGSILRKNIGIAILHNHNDPYLNIWKQGTSPQNYSQQKLQTEEAVSEYLNGKITFTVFPVEEKILRLRYETAIIATLNNEDEFRPSDNWFGKNSTELEIRDSGMWLKEGLKGKVLTSSEFESLCNILRDQI